jgi:hypothetical protein
MEIDIGFIVDIFSYPFGSTEASRKQPSEIIEVSLPENALSNFPGRQESWRRSLHSRKSRRAWLHCILKN